MHACDRQIELIESDDLQHINHVYHEYIYKE